MPLTCGSLTTSGSTPDGLTAAPAPGAGVGAAPPLTTTTSKRDVFTFKCVSSGVYLGFVAGQNL